jgi:hypothetical protein
MPGRGLPERNAPSTRAGSVGTWAANARPLAGELVRRVTAYRLSTRQRTDSRCVHARDRRWTAAPRPRHVAAGASPPKSDRRADARRYTPAPFRGGPRLLFFALVSAGGRIAMARPLAGQPVRRVTAYRRSTRQRTDSRCVHVMDRPRAVARRTCSPAKCCSPTIRSAVAARQPNPAEGRG